MCLACEIYGGIHGLAQHAKAGGSEKEKSNTEETAAPAASSPEHQLGKKETTTHAEE
jgi:hypothetical protein